MDYRGIEVRFPGWVKMFSSTYKPALGANNPPIQYLAGALSLGLERQWHDSNHLLPSSAQVKSGGAYLHSLICLHGLTLKLIRRKDNLVCHLYWQNREISHNILGGHSVYLNSEDTAWNGNSLRSQETHKFPQIPSPFSEPGGFQETDNGNYEPDPTLNFIYASSPYLKSPPLNIQVRKHE